MSAYTRKDAAYREAKRTGFRSRAAIKLVDLDKRYRLFRPGGKVLDLGCWPGGWLQVAAQRVGPSGRVVGIDFAATEPLADRNGRAARWCCMPCAPTPATCRSI